MHLFSFEVNFRMRLESANARQLVIASDSYHHFLRYKWYKDCQLFYIMTWMLAGYMYYGQTTVR